MLMMKMSGDETESDDDQVMGIVVVRRLVLVMMMVVTTCCLQEVEGGQHRWRVFVQEDPLIPSNRLIDAVIFSCVPPSTAHFTVSPPHAHDVYESNRVVIVLVVAVVSCCLQTTLTTWCRTPSHIQSQRSASD